MLVEKIMTTFLMCNNSLGLRPLGKSDDSQKFPLGKFFQTTPTDFLLFVPDSFYQVNILSK